MRRKQQITKLAIIGMLVKLSACSSLPEYRIPESGSSQAFLTANHNNAGLLISTLAVYRWDGAWKCGNPVPNPEKVFMISRGNPLLTNLNQNGVPIPADAKFRIEVISVHDALPSCKIRASFTPRKGGKYLLTVKHLPAPAYAPPSSGHCVVDVSEFSSDNSITTPLPSKTDFQLEECR